VSATTPKRHRIGAAERRERLLDAALHVFLEKGYDGAAMREIAHQAGVTEGLIYHHFAGKRELLLALLQERSPAAAVVGLGERPSKETLNAALDDLLRRILDAFESDADILLLLFGQSMVDDEVADVWAEIVKESAAAISAYLMRLKRADLTGDAPVDMTAQLLVSSCLMFFLNTRRLRVPGLVVDRERFIAGSVALFEKALSPVATGRRQPSRPPEHR
jgi:AcrR family transcriptional regulator